MKLKVINNKILEYGIPEYATPGSAGIDLKACIDEQIIVESGKTILVPTGIAIHIDNPELVGVITPRSGLGHKHGIVLGNLVGIIDSDYTNEIMVSVWNRSEYFYVIKPGDRIAQLLFMPVKQVDFEIVDDFESTSRNGGFGSTGK